MSQPPQSGWGQPPSPNSSGQQGFGNQAPAYGQTSPNGFGQEASFAPAFGDAGGQYSPQGGGSKKSNKLPIIICAGCAVLALLLVIVGGGIWLFTRGGDDTSDGDRTTSAEETTDSPEESSAPEESDAPEEAETPETADTPAGDGDGSKDNPYAIGQPFTIEDGEGGTLEVTIGEINWDATDEVMEVNGGNTEPGDGETYILVPVTVAYSGDGSFSADYFLDVSYDAGGKLMSDEGALVPDSWLDADEITDGGSTSWNFGIIIPADQAKKGMFSVDYIMNFDSEPVWVAAS